MKNAITFLGMVILCLSVKATVNFRTANLNLSGPGGLYVDINNDGFNDFLFTAIVTNPNILKIKGLTAGSKIVSDGASHLNGLNDSVIVGNNFPANIWADSALIYRWDGGIYPFPTDTWKYIGVQLFYNGGTHFGYMLMQFSYANNFSSMNILWIAFEEIAGLGIKTGSHTSLVGINDQLEEQFQVSQSSDGVYFQLGKQSQAQLTVHDIAGHAVYQSAIGAESLKLSTNGLPSGIYLATLESDNRRFSKKFVVY